jgi:hypothetical protein
LWSRFSVSDYELLFMVDLETEIKGHNKKEGDKEILYK